ncbi:Cytosolic enolase 3 [Acorus calamus]|uniref:phosphopyruvate hydratase n=1 Tax=Acorus calamus TaxID=4465 RepID=A0AAV9F819_ACOCL|nr:Cytosolic enolase 3 [Acorus calamus]
MSVQEYLDKHMLSRKIEDAVNAAVRAKAPDPVLFISNHMRKAVPSAITKIKARQVFDSRGIPTVEVDLHTNKGVFRASSPSGVSFGMHEVVELRDGDMKKYLGKGVTKAVKNINEKISEALIGMDPTLQSQIDQAMMDLDKTENKARNAELGANAILAVSIAACKAGAAEKEVSLYKHIADLSGKGKPVLPVPAITVISGGKHAGNNLAAQEIMILPVGALSFEEAMQIGSETYHHLKKAWISLRRRLKEQVILKESNYPLVSIEQPFDKDDWEHAKQFSDLGICQVVGDDLLTSNTKRIERAITESTCNALLLKVLATYLEPLFKSFCGLEEAK